MTKEKELIALFDGFEIPFNQQDQTHCFIPDNEEIERDEEGFPVRFVIIKFGKNRYTIDGNEGEFEFTPEDADRIIDEFNRRGRDLLIDLEHACLIPGNPAPAYGWIKKLTKGQTGLIADGVRWVDEAKDLLRNKKYRYYSPTIYFDEDENSRRPSSLHSLTLTNHPALHNIKELMAANDISDIKIPVEDKIKEFRGIISKIDLELNKLYSIKGFNDESYLKGVQVAFSDNMSRFKKYLEDNLSIDEAIRIYDDFASMLYLSDITNRAKGIVIQYQNDPDQAEIMLIQLKNDNENIMTPSEIDYINALLEQVRQDKRIKNFSDSNSTNINNNNTKRGRRTMDFEKEYQELIALADNVLSDEDIKALGLDEELPAAGNETPPATEAGAEETPEEEKAEEKDIAKVKDLVKALVDQIKEIADVLGIKEEEAGNAEAMSDLIVSKVKEMRESLDKIADAYDSENKSPKALADLVYVNQLGAPDKEEVKKMKEKLAMSDKALKEKAAKEAVEAAIKAGNVPESKREKALRFALSDLEKFNEAFAPGKGIQVVPVEDGKQEKPEGQKEKKKVVSLSDFELRLMESLGRDPENEEDVKETFPEKFN